jgi:hypothetical protein
MKEKSRRGAREIKNTRLQIGLLMGTKSNSSRWSKFHLLYEVIEVE